jgi:hypothetical protein
MMIVPVIAFCTAAISCNRDTMADEPSSEWWEPILQKHGIPLKAYNNFGNILEMGDRNSIDGSVCTLTNATVIIKGNSDDYSIIEGELVSHDLKKEILEVHSGSVKSYKMDAAPSNPSSTMTGASYFKFKINHYY